MNDATAVRWTWPGHNHERERRDLGDSDRSAASPGRRHAALAAIRSAEDGSADPAAIDADDLALLPLQAIGDAAPTKLHEDLPAMLVNPASQAAGLEVVHDNPAHVVSPASASLPVGVFSPEALLSPLEERVRKLEAALAELRDTRQLETRVAARVSDQIAQDLAPATGLSPKAGLVELGKRLLGVAAPPPPRTLGPRPAGKRPGWLLLEILAEARAILRMYFDPRYRMTWVGRVLPIALLVAFFFPAICPGDLPLVGPLLAKISLLVKVVELVIAYVLFKVLAHEARRYRETSPDIPPSMRL